MKALQTIMLSCAKAAEYLNLREEKALSFKQNLQLNMHLLACKTCQAYESQSETIKKMFKHYQSKAASETQNENLPLKESIKGKIEKL
jgi:hypothetical protein